MQHFSDLCHFRLQKVAKRSIVLFTATYGSLESHKSDLNIEVLKLTFLLPEY